MQLDDAQLDKKAIMIYITSLSNYDVSPDKGLDYQHSIYMKTMIGSITWEGRSAACLFALTSGATAAASSLSPHHTECRDKAGSAAVALYLC